MMTKSKIFATATFLDTYLGAQPVDLVERKSTRRGQRVEIYSWLGRDRAVTTGYVPTMYPTKAVGYAQRDHRFSDVVSL
jgi:hypothetical protein